MFLHEKEKYYCSLRYTFQENYNFIYLEISQKLPKHNTWYIVNLLTSLIFFSIKYFYILFEMKLFKNGISCKFKIYIIENNNNNNN